MIELRTFQKTVTPPDQQSIVPVLAEKDLGTTQGTVITFPSFKGKTTTGVPSTGPNCRNEKSRANHKSH